MFAQQDSLPKKWRFGFQFDQKKSFINNKVYDNQPISTHGIAIGWKYKNRFTFGVGGYFSLFQNAKIQTIPWTPLIESNAPNAEMFIKDKTKVYLAQSNTKLFYFTPRFEYKFYKSKWLDISIPIEIGVGYSKMTMTDYFTHTNLPLIGHKDKILKSNNVFIPCLFGVSSMIKLSKDVGFSFSVGYRKILEEIGQNSNYDGIYYQFGLQLFPKNIIQNMKTDYKNRKNKK